MATTAVIKTSGLEKAVRDRDAITEQKVELKEQLVVSQEKQVIMQDSFGKHCYNLFVTSLQL